MKRISNNIPPTTKPSNNSITKIPTKSSPISSSNTTRNQFSTQRSDYSNFQNNPHGFLRPTQTVKNSTIVNQAVADQANLVFRPARGNQPSVSSPSSNSSSSFSPSTSNTSPSPSPLASPLHSSKVGVLSNKVNTNSTGGSVVQTTVKGSPVPKQLNNNDYYDFITCVTTALLAEKYGDAKSVAQLAILHVYANGEAGKNIGNLQNMSTNLNRKIYPFSNFDFTSVISSEDLNTMPSPCADKLKKLPGSRVVTLEEIMAMQSANSGLENKITLRDESKSLSPEEKAWNLSGNISPDFVLERPETYYQGSVPVTEKVFYDAKNMKSPLKDLNNVRVFDQDLKNSTVDAHLFLKKYLEIVRERLPNTEKPKLDDFHSHILANLEKFKETGNLQQFVQDYNHFRDIFSVWLVTNHIPMNLIAKVGVSSFLVDPKIQQEYAKTWSNLADSPTSPAKFFCVDYFQINTKPIYNNSASLVKPFIKYLEEKSIPKDILFD